MCSSGSLKRDRQGVTAVPGGRSAAQHQVSHSCNSVWKALHHFQPIYIRQWHIWHVWLTLIPECNRGDIVLQWQIATATAPAEGLNGHTQVFLEANGVHDVPTIHAE